MTCATRFSSACPSEACRFALHVNLAHETFSTLRVFLCTCILLYRALDDMYVAIEQTGTAS